MSAPVAEVIAIGTELLLGDIVDTNTASIARSLRQIGFNLYRTTAVGDNVGRIAQAVEEALGRAQVVITTGGLGPTVDDATRQAIAQALGVELVFEESLWDQIRERFARFGREPGENNRRQAYLPEGAVAIENPVGTAPAFRAEHAGRQVVALPGVPAEMEHLLSEEVIPFLLRHFGLAGVIQSQLVRTAGVGESWIDERIGDLEQAGNPTVGVAAHPGRVDIRITARADESDGAKALIEPVVEQLRARLGESIYAVGEASLEEHVLQRLADRAWGLVTVESGTQARLAGALAEAGAAFLGGRVLPAGSDQAHLEAELERFQGEEGAQAGLAMGLESAAPRSRIQAQLTLPERSERLERSYGGPLPNAPDWAVSISLEWLRRRLK